MLISPIRNNRGRVPPRPIRTRGGYVEMENDNRDGRDRRQDTGRYRDEVYSRRVPAGKRTYFFDVKTTRSGEDFFLTITESKRLDDDHYDKHKIFLYKEDFGKFVSAMLEVVGYIQEECLPDYEFRGLPDLSGLQFGTDDFADDSGTA